MAVREMGRRPKLVKQKCFLVGWNPAHQKRDGLAHLLNNQIDSLTHVPDMAVEGEEKRKHLLEWLHVKGDHSGFKDLFKGAGDTGCLSPGSCVTLSPQSVASVCTGLEKQHPLQEAFLH